MEWQKSSRTREEGGVDWEETTSDGMMLATSGWRGGSHREKEGGWGIRVG